VIQNFKAFFHRIRKKLRRKKKYRGRAFVPASEGTWWAATEVHPLVGLPRNCPG